MTNPRNIVVVGSGASAVHFTLSLLRKGYEVTMLDIGYEKPAVSNPQDSFIDLKSNLRDPVEYFLGENFQAVIYPDFKSEYYGFPPSKDYVFAQPAHDNIRPMGFAPLFSFAQGGLAEAWTGGSYPFNDKELKDFPFDFMDIEPYYEDVSNRIGITGTQDDLATFFPFHANLMNPLDLDDHSQLLLEFYQKNKEYLNEKLGFFLGRSRTAVLSQDRGGRKRCDYDGRCLWGCPTEALYTPSITLKKCMAFSNFKYLPDMYVTHFGFNSRNKITSIVARSLRAKNPIELTINKLVLAAGTLSTSRIFMNSFFFHDGKIIQLPGLMDNRQILVPFVNLEMIGKMYNPNSYQYHQIAITLRGSNSIDHIHGLLTTLKTALIHPLIQSLPFDLKTSISTFRNVHSALGLINLNFPDHRREFNYLTLEPTGEKTESKLVIRYSPEPNESFHLKKALKRLKKALRKLRCIVPPGVVHIRPMGASVHYAGTIPMSTERIPLTVSRDCQSHDFHNLYIVDGTTFPSLPSKNITFTLMANAVRVAEKAF
jgi:choline dehydrogenase-like flavoprotein